MSREDRLVENQERFRQANERLRNVVGNRVVEERVPFLCECADQRCLGVVELELDMYEAVREHPNRYFVLPGHAAAGVEEIVEEMDRFQIVEKQA